MSDSEFDTSAEEEEFRLYTELYFNDKNKSESILSTGGKLNVASNASKNIQFNHSSELCKNSDSSIGNRLSLTVSPDVSIRRNKLPNKKCNSKSCNQSDDALSKNLSDNHNSDSVSATAQNSTQPEGNSITTDTINPNAKRKKRNNSSCSIDSISGKQPLDSLYCNSPFDNTFDLQQQTLDTILESYPPNDECNSDEESRYNILSSSCKNDLKVNNPRKKKCDSCSSNEDVCILPPSSQRTYDTLTLDTDSDNSVKILQYENKRQKQKVSPKRNKKPAGNMISISSNSDESDSDFDVAAAKTPMMPITVNVRTDKYSSSTTFTSKTIRKQSIKVAFKKTQVIFNKNRPLTRRNPTCIKWTPEMASFYDSDVSEEFNVEDIHASQSDNGNIWKIDWEDYPVKIHSRYFNKAVRCVRCREFGHVVKDCTRIPHCLYCGSEKHRYTSKCPYNCCLRCGMAPHGYCHITNNHTVCHECGQVGHNKKLCPDLWRRFHSTTSGHTPVRPKRENNKLMKRIPYCYNCAKKGHYGHDCRATNYKKYQLVSTLAFSYLPVHNATESGDTDVLPYQNSSIESSTQPFPTDSSACQEVAGTNDSAALDPVKFGQGEENAKQVHKDLPVSDIKKSELVQKKVQLSRAKTRRFTCKKRKVLCKIINKSGANILMSYVGKSLKMLISGTAEQVTEAGEMFDIFLNKMSSKKNRGLMQKVETFKSPTKSCVTDISYSGSELGTPHSTNTRSPKKSSGNPKNLFKVTEKFAQSNGIGCPVISDRSCKPIANGNTDSINKKSQKVKKADFKTKVKRTKGKSNNPDKRQNLAHGCWKGTQHMNGHLYNQFGNLAYQQQQQFGNFYQQQQYGNLYQQQRYGNLYQQQRYGNLYQQQRYGNLYQQQRYGNLYQQQQSGNLDQQQQYGNLYQQQQLYLRPDVSDRLLQNVKMNQYVSPIANPGCNIDQVAHSRNGIIKQNHWSFGHKVQPDNNYQQEPSSNVKSKRKKFKKLVSPKVSKKTLMVADGS